MKPLDDLDIRLLQAAAHPTRLAILRQLSADGPTCACDFSDCCRDLSQPTVSHHLKVLREAGWISGERRGTWIWYSLRPEAIECFAGIAAGMRTGSSRPAMALAPAGRAEDDREGEGARDPAVARPAWRQW